MLASGRMAKSGSKWRRSTASILALVATTAAIATSTPARRADAAPQAPSASTRRTARAPQAKHGPFAWCAEELETLPNGLCYIDGGQPEGRRTLVVFLHGAIAKDVDWQWQQARALARQAKQSKFEAVFARAPLGENGYVWPGTAAARQGTEDGLVDGWNAARELLEKRNGRAYDEVYLMGFSSGAYFVSSLALRGRTKFDGYATFAGGAGGIDGPVANDVPKVPIFVGVCADDRQTAAHSRSFGATLGARGFPHRVDEQKIGHMFGDVHVAHAVSYLRNAAKSRSAARN